MLNSPISFITASNIFTKDQCLEIIEKAKSTGYKTDGKVGGTIKKEFGLPSGEIVHVDEKIRKTDLYFFNDTDTFNTIMPHIGTINRDANWNFALSQFEALQLGAYSSGGHYDWHVDEHPYPYSEEAGPFKGLVRKISFSILLNDRDEYTGGDFEIEDQLPGTVPRTTIVTGLEKAGDLLVFPSFTPHKVHPVTQGTRYSLVGWICGEPWR